MQHLLRAHADHMRRRGLAAGTIATRRRRLALFHMAVALADATYEDVEAFLDRRDLGDKARYDWISHLHQFYGWAIDNDHLDHDPTRRVIRPRQRRNLPRPIPTSDLVTALDMATPDMRSWLTLMSLSGLRCMEVAGLDVESILWDDNLLRILGKGSKERLVPMHPEVARTLQMTRRPKRGRVFQRPRGGGYPSAQVSREVSVYLDSLGIAATAHQLRHWFGTNLYRACRDLRVVQEMMGHSSPTTTAIYADWSREEATRAIGALSFATFGDPHRESTLFTDWPATGT